MNKDQFVQTETGKGYKILCRCPICCQRKAFPFWHPSEDQDAILLYPHST